MPGKIYLIPNIIHPDTESEVLPPLIPSMIQRLKYYLVENERSGRRYISNLMKMLPPEQRTRIDELEFIKLDKHTHPHEATAMLDPVLKGMDSGIISESGCPGIADPGSVAVKAAHELGIDVVPIPGPSSIFMALMASGMNGQTFTFHGYLPIKKDQLISKIRQLEHSCRKDNSTQIFIETPYRNQNLYDTLLANCSGNSKLCVAADITGPKVSIRTTTIAEWKKQKIKFDKIPAVFLLSS